MKFRTEIPPLKILPQVDHQTKLVSLGSCFSEEIGQKLKVNLFPVTLNPFGVLYNPQSVSNAILIGMEKLKITDEDLVEQGGLYHSFYHHSSILLYLKKRCAIIFSRVYSKQTRPLKQPTSSI